MREYTHSDRFALAGHSLGVTLARQTPKLHPELRDDLVAFVGIAGANHGTGLCPPGSEGVVKSCDEIAAGTQWLANLNGPVGRGWRRRSASQRLRDQPLAARTAAEVTGGPPSESSQRENRGRAAFVRGPVVDG